LPDKPVLNSSKDTDTYEAAKEQGQKAVGEKQTPAEEDLSWQDTLTCLSRYQRLTSPGHLLASKLLALVNQYISFL